jgi:hypothetical protein
MNSDPISNSEAMKPEVPAGERLLFVSWLPGF